MNKKIIFWGVLALVIIVVAVGFFWWGEEKLSKNIYKNTVINTGDYEVLVNREEKTIKNQEEGISFNIPIDWTIKKYGEELDLLGPGIKFDEKGAILFENAKNNKVCGMGIEIYKSEKVDQVISTYVDDVRNMILRIKNNPQSIKEDINKKIESVVLASKDAIKKTYLKNGEIIRIEVEIPVNQKVFIFSSDFLFTSACIEEFNKILSTLSII